MDHQFWHDRWVNDEIGFHQSDINLLLKRHWSALSLEEGCGVLVPLCGKSRDMLWLLERGHRVLGVELNKGAVSAFFEESRLVARPATRGAFRSWAQGQLELLCGDFFTMQAEDLAGIEAVYDRAALIALPPEMRVRYATHLAGILPVGTELLLITLSYDQALSAGPPFSVSPEEVQALFGPHFRIEVLERLDALEANPKFKNKGLPSLEESAYRLVKLP